MTLIEYFQRCIMNLKCLIIITIIIPITFLIIGTPLAAASFNNYTVADFFTSLPLITNQSIFQNIYFINTDLNSDLFLFNMKVQDKKIKRKDIYLMHNMFGYKIDANLIVNDISIDVANISRNINLSETKPLKRRALSQHKLYKSAFKKVQISKNVFNVFCPISTEITRTKEIDQYCRNNYIPMIFDGYYSLVHIFSPIKSNMNGQITIQFFLFLSI